MLELLEERQLLSVTTQSIDSDALLSQAILGPQTVDSQDGNVNATATSLIQGCQTSSQSEANLSVSVSNSVAPQIATTTTVALGTPVAEPAYSLEDIANIDVMNLSSLPSSNFTIYLDFDGHTTTGTLWNSNFTDGEDIVTPRFSLTDTEDDAEDTGFTDAEKLAIYEIWQRVSEDYMPFDVNVTTANPGDATMSQAGSIRVAIGGTSDDWYKNPAGGIAYVGSFNYASDTPCFVFSIDMYSAKNVAAAVSHEVGHTLGLGHDGSTLVAGQLEYYSGANGWAPIMGVGYYQPLTQWSKGEYEGATNKQDDLAIISRQNGFSYRSDDFGSSITSAYKLDLDLSGTTVIHGIVEQNTDYDYFKLDSAGGTYTFSIGGIEDITNLDVKVEVYNSAQTLLYTYDPQDSLSVSFSFHESYGTYYFVVSGTGRQDGAYSDYGSLGAYTMTIGGQPSSYIIVNTEYDLVNSHDEYLSLREALGQVFDGGVIVFDSTLRGKTILLNGTELTTDKSVRIDAASLYNPETNEPGLTIDAQHVSRIFNFHAGTYQSPVELIGLSLINGFSGDEYSSNGGAIKSTGYLYVTDCSITNSNISAPHAYGAGIYNQGTLHIQNTKITGNTLSGTNGYGGAIYNYGNLTVTNSLLANNASTYFGGAIYNNGSTTLTNCTVSKNSSLYGGGLASLNNGNTVSVSNSIIALNTATLLGGDIYRYQSTIYGRNVLSSFDQWSSESKNLFLYDETLPLFADASNNQFQLVKGSQASNLGDNSSAIYTNSSKILKDLAGTDRILYDIVDLGAYELTLSKLSTPTILSASSQDNSQIHLTWTAIDGAAGYVIEYSLTDDFADATSFSMDSGTSATVTNLLPNKTYYFRMMAQGDQVTGLDSEWSVTVNETTKQVKLTAPIIISATPQSTTSIRIVWTPITNASGYTLQVSADSSFQPLQEYTYGSDEKMVTIDQLNPESQYFFRLKVLGDGNKFLDSGWSLASSATTKSFARPLTVNSLGDFSTFSDNTLTLRQAIQIAKSGETITFAPLLAGETITLTQGELVLDKAITIDASSLRTEGAAGITIQRSETAEEFHIFHINNLEAQAVQLSYLSITGGSSAQGGGIYQEAGSLNLYNCAIFGNTATKRGAGIYQEAGTLTLVNNTIAGNHAEFFGGGIYSTGQIFATNTIVAQNTSGKMRDICVEGEGTASGTNNLSSFQNWILVDSAVNWVYSSQPLFTDAPNNDYTLCKNSVASNMGLNSAALNYNGAALPYDLAGNVRILDDSFSTVDLGAYENQAYQLQAKMTLSVSERNNFDINVNIEESVGAVSYTLRYSTDPNFETYETKYWTSAGTKTFSELAETTPYYFKLIATADKESQYLTSAWSEVQTITTHTKLAALPGLATSSAFNSETYDAYLDAGTPELSMDSIDITLRWSKEIVDAAGYLVQISESASFTTFTEYEYDAPGTYTLSGMTGNTLYYVRIAAKASGDSSFGNSDWFETSLKTRKVTLAAPELTLWSTGDNAKFTFDSIYGARNYTVRYSTDPEMTTYQSRFCPSANVTRTIGGLDGNSTYYFKIIASNSVTTSSFTSSLWSDSISLTTKIALDKPVVSAQTIDATSVNLVISAVDNADKYLIRYSKSTTLSDYVEKESNTAGNVLIDQLDSNSTYYFRVIASGSGIYGESAASSLVRAKTNELMLHDAAEQIFDENEIWSEVTDLEILI